MNHFSPVVWFRNISIARKLYFTVGVMALLIATELVTLMFAIQTLSAVRTYVGAEGLWSKAQKDAVYSLQLYGRTHDEKYYKNYLNFLKVPLGDRITRLELLKEHPDMQVAYNGFLQGRFHPDDIAGALKLFMRFHNVSYISKAITVWTKGDMMIPQLMAIGDQLHTEINAANPSQVKINTLLNSIEPLNDQLTKLEDEFSFTLGEGSRWLTGLLLKLLLTLVLTVEICGLSLTILVSRQIAAGLNEIIRSASSIATGDYTSRSTIYSKDEIGTLANSFNSMAHTLEKNIDVLKKSEEELRIAKRLAEESVVIKNQFLANMSHEIRTPMNAIMGYTTLLTDTRLDSDQREYLTAIKASEQTLMNIINDILDFSKIESGMIAWEDIPLSIKNTLKSLKGLMQPKADSKSLTLKVDLDENIPEMVLGDPKRLMQVLLNLSDNALKFTEKGGIEISAKLEQDNDDNCQVSFFVKDTGIGIPPDKMEIIFERFRQVSGDTTRKFGGTGLGLSIAKSLVDLKGGVLKVESSLGEGSKFFFALTFKKIKQEPFSIKNENSIHEVLSKPLKILIVEDNKLNQTVTGLILKKFGFIPEVADNGKIAIDMLGKSQYDLILMDMQMPEMDGYEATRIIRNEMKSYIPIIALTAHAMAREKEKCLKLGMNEFIAKPFNKDDLYKKIVSFFPT